MTFTRRELVTIATPVLIVLLGSRLLLPGVSEMVERAGVAPERFGVFGLGIFPFVAAYQLVEIVAFLVPSLSRRRHGDPALRARLDLAVHFVTLAIAALQALSFAMQLSAIGRDSSMDVGTISVPMVVTTLVGGVCVQVVASKLITRAGLANGTAVLLAASVVQRLGADFGTRLHGTARPSTGSGLLSVFMKSPAEATPVEIVIVVCAMAVLVAAAAVALFRASGMHLSRGSAADGPYRSARALVLHPTFPVPSSSYGALSIARSLVLLPSVLVLLRVPGAEGMQDALASSSVLYLTVLLLTVVLALWLHRPRELFDLTQRLGLTADPADTRRALTKTLLPSFLFFATVILAGRAAKMDLSDVPLLVAVVMDLFLAVKIARSNTAWVSVWEERRATAVPVLRAVLAARGIVTQVRGMSLLWLMQLFAPFAPAVICVKPEDAQRAHDVLASLSLASGDSASAEAPANVDAPELLPGRRLVYLLATAAMAGVIALGAARLDLSRDERWAAVDTGPPAELELVRIDDSSDPLADTTEESLPAGEGIAIYKESVPVGDGATADVHFARIAARPGEAKAATRTRFRAWLDRVPQRASGEQVRFGVEEMNEQDDRTGKQSFVGYRSILLTGAPELTNADVEDAMVTLDQQTNEPNVAVTLSPAGARKFEDVTARWTRRRMAIVLDGVIQSAPVIRSVIKGGHLTLSMGRAEPEKALADAHRIERSLRGRR
jgi:hypothetical protein